jgi:hypothetical protein
MSFSKTSTYLGRSDQDVRLHSVCGAQSGCVEGQPWSSCCGLGRRSKKIFSEEQHGSCQHGMQCVRHSSTCARLACSALGAVALAPDWPASMRSSTRVRLVCINAEQQLRQTGLHWCGSSRCSASLQLLRQKALCRCSCVTRLR